MNILAIDTSADETAVAVTSGRRVLSNAIFSQIATHTKWGGIYPALAKRAHEERIDFVVSEAIQKASTKIFSRVNSSPSTYSVRSGSSNTNSKKNFVSAFFHEINYIAVTQGPGLAVALEVGIRKAKELATKYKKKLIAVNHLEGHIYSSFVQNSAGNPKRDYHFPYLALIVSGGHTEIVLFKDHLTFEILGETRDDAAGEALDKAAKMLGLGYPGGPVIERLALEVDNKDFHTFPRPMIKSNNLDLSFSGLKTSFYYFLRGTTPKSPPFQEGDTGEVRKLASSFQEAVFETLIAKTEQAIKRTGINRIIVGGGVIANIYLRRLLRDLIKKHNGEVLFPPYKYLTGDNAAMIGIVAYYKAQKRDFVSHLDTLDRTPRLTLG